MRDAIIQVRVSAQDKKRLKRLAKENNISMSEAIVRMIENSSLGGFLDGMPEEERAFMAHVINYSAEKPELRHLLLWLAGNRQYMATHGHLLTPEEREAWAQFMNGLGRVFSAHLAGAIDVERKKASN
ncbi:MAG: ribbon-helix-helix protein, CopG family [Phaeodactylibacter sp.]|nr:ribbon-helix-helix protein, CopG family [Phaeodactylibacter sp.]